MVNLLSSTIDRAREWCHVWGMGLILDLDQVTNLLTPAACELMQWKGPRVKSFGIQKNYVEDSIELAVVHTLFCGHELRDGAHKKFFRGRFLEAILANNAPNGRQLMVERRAMAARAQRARKMKAVPCDPSPGA
jgi:hypothetical protein